MNANSRVRVMRMQVAKMKLETSHALATTDSSLMAHNA